MTLLELKHVRKDYGGLRAVDDVSFAVPQGKIIGLIGPNGSGKSTLINLIAGTTEQTAGEIWFDGVNITHFSSDEVFQHGIARGYQDPALYSKMTVLDNMLIPVKHQKGENPWYAPWRRTWQPDEMAHARRAVDILEQVLLKEHYNKLASDLSGGQMKLLEIARALMGDPKLLLLDEPTAGVAPKLAYQIFEQIARLRADLGMTFLIVEHRLEILFDFVDYLYVMHMGNLLAEGTAEAIQRNQTVRDVYFGD
ncbi:MAG: ABC transporter ATP-binding protein [Anaerolineae bacterium]|nr:ABC transporter ATP-binding protein [Anaerolineae bacterium]MCA9888907.1 ABC transporter ATP-binding protein [Anaerolineae bacterium]